MFSERWGGRGQGSGWRGAGEVVKVLAGNSYALLKCRRVAWEPIESSEQKLKSEGGEEEQQPVLSSFAFCLQMEEREV